VSREAVGLYPQLPRKPAGRTYVRRGKGGEVKGHDLFHGDQYDFMAAFVSMMKVGKFPRIVRVPEEDQEEQRDDSVVGGEGEHDALQVLCAFMGEKRIDQPAARIVDPFNPEF
jgi:hypothetical protein